MKYSNHGQTILEVVIALALIILFLSSIVVIELVAIRNMTYAQHVSMASRLARQQLERARVIRDTDGIAGLSACSVGSCYINPYLTPVPAAPTGIYEQSLKIISTSSSDCPLPEAAITPAPVSYKLSVVISWAQQAVVSPAPQVEMSSCLTDWR